MLFFPVTFNETSPLFPVYFIRPISSCHKGAEFAYVALHYSLLLMLETSLLNFISKIFIKLMPIKKFAMMSREWFQVYIFSHK